MTQVTVQPDGITFEARVGETLMGAAQARGLYWPTTCGGQGVCTTCLSEVVSGAEALNEMGRSERKTLVNERGEAILNPPRKNSGSLRRISAKLLRNFVANSAQ